MINSEIAELCGTILGDGNLHKSSNRITITGSIDDLDYYQSKIIPLFVKYFNGKVFLRKRKDRNSYYMWIENKEAFNFFLDIGFQRGNKSKSGIPIKIMENPKLWKPFLRGLFDTDGYLKFSKQNKEYAYYPRIRFTFQESPLIGDLKEILTKLGFNYSLHKDRRYSTYDFEISGKSNLEKWMGLIGINNPVKLKKYQYWKKHGVYIPK